MPRRCRRTAASRGALRAADRVPSSWFSSSDDRSWWVLSLMPWVACDDHSHTVVTTWSNDRSVIGASIHWGIRWPIARRRGVRPPETRFAKSGDAHIAYQVVGAGPDLVYVPGWVSNVELNWGEPSYSRFL